MSYEALFHDIMLSEGFVEADSTASSRRPILYPTNRYNLLEIQSSRLLCARAAYNKYYRDLLEISVGLVPLFGGPIGSDVVSLCTSEGTATFPVVLEIPRANFGPEQARSLPKSGKSRKSVPGDDKAVAWALAKPMVVTSNCVIHFRTVGELEEHTLQEYDNVRHDDWVYQVSPELFGGESNSKALSWLAKLKGDATPSADELIAADKEGGAIALLAGGSANSNFAKALSEWLLSEVSRRNSELPAYFAFLTSRCRQGIDRESRLFYAIVSTLDKLNNKSFSATGFLDALMTADELIGLNSREKSFVDQGIAHLRAVLANDIEFVSFPNSSGSTMLRALMLFTLRPEPRRLASWDPLELNANEQVFAAALLFSGYLCGRKRLPSVFRPAPLDYAIAAHSASRLGKGQVRISSPSAIDSKLGLLLATIRGADKGAERDEAAKAFARSCGWTDCFVEEYEVNREDVKDSDQDIVRVWIRRETAHRSFFSEEIFCEHMKLQFGEG